MRRADVPSAHRYGAMRPVLGPLAVMTAIQLVATMTFLAVPVLAPALAADLGVEASAIGVYSSLVFVGAMLVSLVSGPLMRRHGALRLCQVGLVFAALALASTVLARLPLILLTAAVVGFGYGPATPAGSHVLARVTPARMRGLVFSLKQSAVPFGGVLVGLSLPALAVTFGWRTALAAVVALVLLTVLAVQPARARLDDDRQPGATITAEALWGSLLLVLGRPALRDMAFCCLVFAGAQLCLFAVLVAYLVSDAGLDLVDAGIAYATMQASGVLARVVWGWVSDRLLSARAALGLMGLGSAGFVLALTALTPATPFALLLGLAVMLGVTASGWNGVALAEVARVAPEDVANATAGTVVFTYLGVVVGPSAFSALVALIGGYDGAFYVLAGLDLLAAAALFRSLRRR